MNVLIAPDSFKGSLSAVLAAGIIREAVLASDPAVRCTILPQADGGEGTIDAMYTARGGTLVNADIPDLGGTPKPVRWLLTDDGDAIIESAECIGWELPAGVARDPESLLSTGLGLLLRIVANRCSRISIALGGSATSDCGLGFAGALGAVFHGVNTSEHSVSARLASLRSIRYDAPTIPGISVLADVHNPLTGRNGAVFTYGPQKGIPEGALAMWDAAFDHYAEIVRRDVREVDQDAEGMGSAGGLGFALAAFCAAETLNGADVVRSITGFDDALQGCDLVITGEGSIDAQTLQGKVVHGVARVAAARGVPVLAFTGRSGEEAEALAAALGIKRIVGITPPGISVEQGMREAARHLYDAVRSTYRSSAR